ncbi:universal stress protein [Streptosporangium canum]|uniref:universal stress protein n=1 Tax=Streptosporangium canum TaxID=324952 RepID=UPI00369DD45B
MSLPASRHVVVALDGSPCSITALRRGAAEADRTDAQLVVVHVLRDRPGGPAGERERLSASEREMEALIAATLRGGPAAAARTVVAYGDPARVIIHHARHADLLLVGAGGGGTALNGSTLDLVLQDGPCPILVCSSSDTADRMSWTVRLPARSHGRPLS